MLLRKIALVNYKNLASETFTFQHKINCFTGKNGIGKTTILDAIYYLAFGKSYFNPIALQNVKHGEDFFVVEGTFEKHEEEEHILCSFKKGQKKIVKRNGKPYEKLSDHVGFIPIVIISPADNDLIVAGSETRRKFVDSVISQSNKNYLQYLIKYNKVLQQRNALLKYFALNSTFDATTLGIYNEQLSTYGTEIFNIRKAFLDVFIPIFKEEYKAITSGKETVNITYQSNLHEKPLDALFTKNLAKDKVLQYTSVGIHKDDLVFEIDEYPIKKYGSQGQQKSFLIALKLAQFNFMKNQHHIKPILLLDDIFDKLDEVRVSKIIQLVNQDEFGQIFISDTHAKRTEDVVKEAQQPYEIFEL